jgi:hypothetical protein
MIGPWLRSEPAAQPRRKRRAHLEDVRRDSRSSSRWLVDPAPLPGPSARSSATSRGTATAAAWPRPTRASPSGTARAGSTSRTRASPIPRRSASSAGSVLGQWLVGGDDATFATVLVRGPARGAPLPRRRPAVRAALRATSTTRGPRRDRQRASLLTVLHWSARRWLQAPADRRCRCVSPARAHRRREMAPRRARHGRARLRRGRAAARVGASSACETPFVRAFLASAGLSDSKVGPRDGRRAARRVEPRGRAVHRDDRRRSRPLRREPRRGRAAASPRSRPHLDAPHHRPQRRRPAARRPVGEDLQDDPSWTAPIVSLFTEPRHRHRDDRRRRHHRGPNHELPQPLRLPTSRHEPAQEPRRSGPADRAHPVSSMSSAGGGRTRAQSSEENTTFPTFASSSLAASRSACTALASSSRSLNR